MKEIVYLYKMDIETLREQESLIYDLLSDRRKEKYDKLKVEHAKLQSLSAGRLLDIALDDYGDEKAFYNISHSGDYVVVAVSDGAVGIDIETKTDKDFKVTGRMFASEDQDYISGSQERFRDVWTIKESFLKCTGEGISVPLDSFTFEPAGPVYKIVSKGYDLKGADYYAAVTRLDDDKCSLSVCSQNSHLTLDIRRVEVLV